ncbi:hypothetical protein E2C01_063098 [Portunus trituberculatus]|uniref:Uncharacterized protein n=1 Tax=Portunus trituberculatus TaxID=210409 RepID=A0A5B7HJD1_PORTR|nr:hypothetical protein [Portunus trituberculatus]
MGVTASTTRDANPSSGSSSRGRSTKRRSPVGCSSASGSELRCYSGYSSEDQCSCSECDSELPSTPRERRPPLRTQSEVLRGPHQPYVRGYIADTKTSSAAKPREGRVVRRPSQPLVKNYIADIQNRSGNKAESRERKAKHDLPSHTHQTHNTLPSPRPTTYPNPGSVRRRPGWHCDTPLIHPAALIRDRCPALHTHTYKHTNIHNR